LSSFITNQAGSILYKKNKAHILDDSHASIKEQYECLLIKYNKLYIGVKEIMNKFINVKDALNYIKQSMTLLSKRLNLSKDAPKNTQLKKVARVLKNNERLKDSLTVLNSNDKYSDKENAMCIK